MKNRKNQVAKQSNIIEMNGRRYDAYSGALLGGSAKQAGSDIIKAAAVTNLAPPKPALKPIAKKPVMDGFVRKAGTVSARQVHAAPSRSQTLKRSATHNKAVKAAEVAKKATKVAITTPKPQPAHTPTKSKTLMRTSVAKPVIARKPALVAKTHTAALAPVPPKGIVHKKMSDVVDTSRERRALGTPQHGKVSRFHKETRLMPAISAVHIPVTPAPRPEVAKTVRPVQATGDIFTQALQSARSHEQVYIAPKKRRPSVKALSSAAVALALLVFVGWLGVANKSTIEMQMASAQAGFSATMPTYTPEGFKYVNLHRQPAQVVLNYEAVAHEAGYTINEQPSAWDSQTLVEAFLSTTKDTYDVYQRSGRTIYVYGNNATWVSNGVWYQVTTKGHGLTTEQLLSIAQSL